jgi:hypothetical protein
MSTQQNASPDVESPSKDQMQGASGPPAPPQPSTEEKLRKVDADVVDAEDGGHKGSDQDIDTAGTEADDHPLTRPDSAPARSRP